MLIQLMSVIAPSCASTSILSDPACASRIPTKLPPGACLVYATKRMLLNCGKTRTQVACPSGTKDSITLFSSGENTAICPSEFKVIKCDFPSIAKVQISWTELSDTLADAFKSIFSIGEYACR